MMANTAYADDRPHVIAYIRAPDERDFVDDINSGFRDSGISASEIDLRIYDYRSRNDVQNILEMVLPTSPKLLIVGGTMAVLLAKQATTSIPILFRIGGDPIRSKIVATLANLAGMLVAQVHKAAI